MNRVPQIIAGILFLACLPIAVAAEVRLETRPNILLICVDDLRPELHCYGVDYIQSPNIDRLASEGRAFARHYVQAPTCGASRYTLLTGRYAPEGPRRGNGALFARATKLLEEKHSESPALPALFRAAGYVTVSVGKVSHHPGGRGGKGWADDSEPEMPLSWDRHSMPVGDWKTPEGTMHGLANGQVRVRGKMSPIESAEGGDEIYPDGLTTNAALEELSQLSKGDKPFFLAVGLLKPHLPFGAPAKYMEPYGDIELPPIPHPEKPGGRTTWHGSGEFMGNYGHNGHDPRRESEYAETVRKHYAACVTSSDANVGRLLDRLQTLGESDNTIVVLWGDHGWHLGEHSIWGKHALFEESLRAPLIIRAPEIKQPGQFTSQIVETIDIYPTLADLCDVAAPQELDGRSLRPLLSDPSADFERGAIGYKNNVETIRTDRFRLIRHQKGDEEPFFELYDHASAAGETVNVAGEHPEVVRQLADELDRRIP